MPMTTSAPAAREHGPEQVSPSPRADGPRPGRCPRADRGPARFAPSGGPGFAVSAVRVMTGGRPAAGPHHNHSDQRKEDNPGA
jgi:hypothetical protein